MAVTGAVVEMEGNGSGVLPEGLIKNEGNCWVVVLPIPLALMAGFKLKNDPELIGLGDIFATAAGDGSVAERRLESFLAKAGGFASAINCFASFGLASRDLASVSVAVTLLFAFSLFGCHRRCKANKPQ
jgi:hypothetical protein